MTFGIIIRGKNQPERGNRFKPHFNRSIVTKANPNGTYIHTKEQYRDELKKNNLVPYDANDYKDKKEKKYVPSKWAHEMVGEIKRTDGNPGGAFYDQLSKKGMTPKKLNKLKEQAVRYTKGVDPTKGGFQGD